MHTLITGGAGFIGSHLVDALLTNGNKVSAFDNLSAGTLQNIRQWLDNPNLTFIKGDLLNPSDLKKLEHNHYDLAFHLAANPEIRVGSTNPEVHFQQNIVATHRLLEHIRRTGTNPTLVFASTSTVYGEPTKSPHPKPKRNAKRTRPLSHIVNPLLTAVEKLTPNPPKTKSNNNQRTEKAERIKKCRKA